MRPANMLIKDCFNAIHLIRDLPLVKASQAREFHDWLGKRIDQVRNAAIERRYDEGALQDLTYAIVGYADEVIANQKEPLRSAWLDNRMQLQFRYFQEVNAGEIFFSNLKRLMDGASGDRQRGELLYIYHLVLLFGFQGKHAGGGGTEIEELLRRLAAMAESREPGENAPDKDRDGPQPRRMWQPALWAGALTLFCGLAMFILLRQELHATSESAAMQLVDDDEGSR